MQKKKYIIAMLLLASGSAALAQLAIPVIDIAASRTEQRRLDTAASMVVGHDELLRYGDQSLADALKRVAGITIGGVPGRGGELRMRGLGNGYTQILLNGQPVPSGFAIDSIAPDLIERVEVRRVASAELGTQAIAGTINIVLRKSVAPSQRELKPTLSLNQGRLSPSATAQLNGKAPGLSYTVAAVMAENSNADLQTTEELGPDLQRITQRYGQSLQHSLNLSPRFSWTLAGGDTLTSQSFARVLHLHVAARSQERSLAGAPSQFPVSAARFDADAATARTDLQWQRERDDGTRLEMKAGINRFRRTSVSTFSAFDAAAGRDGARQVDSTATENSVTLAAKWSRAFGGGHALAIGWDGALGRRTETRREQSGFVNDAAGNSDERYGAALDRIALFAQDDWRIGQAWSVSAGLRWEGLSTSTSGQLDEVAQRSHLLSPIIQSLYKLSDSDQLRLGVSRTFKAPGLIELAQRRYTVDNNNGPNNPDTQGNPYLKPERAWGLDLAYEHYLGQRGMLGASAYARRIDGVVIERTFQSGPTWIRTPYNQGRALTWGMELEAKLPLRSVWPGAPATELRANLARNWSRVDGIAGPDNRLAGQLPYSANLGLDQRLQGIPLTLGASFSVQGGTRSRLSEHNTAWTGPKRELELVGAWTSDARSQWQLALSNLLHRDSASQSTYADQDGTLQSNSVTPTAATVRLTFTHKLGNGSDSKAPPPLP